MLAKRGAAPPGLVRRHHLHPAEVGPPLSGRQDGWIQAEYPI